MKQVSRYYLVTFATDLILLIVLFALMSVYNRSMLKRLGLLESMDVKGMKGSSNHYFSHQIPLQCLAAETAAHKSSTSVCLVGMSTRKYCPKCGSKMKRVG